MPCIAKAGRLLQTKPAYGGNIVSVINAATNAVVATVTVGVLPAGVAFNPAGTFAYVANNGSNSVSVIDTATNAVVATVAVGIGPVAMGNFIGGPAGKPATIPTLTEWAIALMAGSLLMFGMHKLRRLKRSPNDPEPTYVPLESGHANCDLDDERR